MELSRRRCFVNFFCVAAVLFKFLFGIAVFRGHPMYSSSLVVSIKMEYGRGEGEQECRKGRRKEKVRVKQMAV